MEHRWGTRVAIHVPVRISATSLAGAGILRNLSASGAFIETALPIAPLTLVRIEMPRSTARDSRRADAWGFVVRQDVQGVGIEWCDVAPWRADDLSQPTQVMHSPARLQGSHKVAQR
jgi:hypothetical protein